MYLFSQIKLQPGGGGGGGGGAPEPGAGDTILFQVNMNEATSAEQRAPWDGDAGNFTRVAPGRDDVGAAMRITYDVDNWWSNTIGVGFPAAADVYCRYYFRFSVGAKVTMDGNNFNGMKWFMWHRTDDLGSSRITCGVSDISGGPPGFANSGQEFTVHDNASVAMPNPFCCNINKTKRVPTTNDGLWHKYTNRFKVGTPSVAQLWIDDILCLDTTSYAYDDTSGLLINGVSLPGTLVEYVPGYDFTIDLDDFVVWHK